MKERGGGQTDRLMKSDGSVNGWCMRSNELRVDGTLIYYTSSVCDFDSVHMHLVTRSSQN